MCKKSLLQKLKSFSQSLPQSAQSLKSSTSQKPTQIIPPQQMQKLLQKTKQQLEQKQKQLTQKSKQLLNNKNINIKQNASKILQSANQIKNKVIESQTLKNSKESLGDKKDKVIEGLKTGKEYVGKKTGDVLKSTGSMLGRQKEAVQQLSSKLKQKISKKQQVAPRLTDKIKQTSNSIIDKIAQMGVSKNQTQQQPNQPPKKQQTKQLPPPVTQQKSSYHFSAANIAKRLLQKSKKIHGNMFTNNIVKNTQNIFIKMLSSLYWRFLFAVCLVALIYVSPKLILSINQVYMDHQRLLLEQKQLQQKKQKNISSSQSLSVPDTKQSQQKDEEFSWASKYK